LLNTVQKAWPEESALFVILLNVQFTGAKSEYFLEYDQNIPKVFRAGKRPEQSGAVRSRFSCNINTRVIFAFCDLQIGKRFIINKVGVIRWTDVFDQPGFCEHGFDFTGGLKEINVFDLVKHLGNFGSTRCNRIHALLKVTGDTRTQIFRFTNVQDLIGRAFHKV